MEFLDEETRPRFLFQSRVRPPPPPGSEEKTLELHVPSLVISLSLSTLLFVLSILFVQTDPLKSILIWFALSLLLGPFSPSSITGGDIRVGVGRVLEPLPQSVDLDGDDPKKKTPNRRSRARKPEEVAFDPTPEMVSKPKKVANSGHSSQYEGNGGGKSVIDGGEGEWSEGDFELLKKLVVKYPVGKQRRWEVIAEAFQGRFSLESVIKMAKSMGEKKMSDADSYTRFLKDRKPVDQRVEAEGEGEVKGQNGGVIWSAGEDIALLNALKAFPKDVSMRWDKIAAAVPGKPKPACVKRVSELKKDFRSSKASTEA